MLTVILWSIGCAYCLDIGIHGPFSRWLSKRLNKKAVLELQAAKEQIEYELLLDAAYEEVEREFPDDETAMDFDQHQYK